MKIKYLVLNPQNFLFKNLNRKHFIGMQFIVLLYEMLNDRYSGLSFIVFLLVP